jgi:hypothetical protein
MFLGIYHHFPISFPMVSTMGTTKLRTPSSLQTSATPDSLSTDSKEY